MTEILALITELLSILKPVLSPTEYDKYLKQLTAIEEKNAKLSTEIKAALASGDVELLDTLLGLIFDL